MVSGREMKSMGERESETDKALKLLWCHCATPRAESKVSVDLYNTA